MAEETSPPTDAVTFPSIVALDMGFNPQEDRVVMIARTHNDGRRIVLLTRRMMTQLLGHYAELMKRTSPAVARAPSAHLDEVLQMEHVSALSKISPPSPAQDAAKSGEKPETLSPETVHLVSEIRMQVSDSQLMIGFMGQRRHAPDVDEAAVAPVAAATMDRTEAHRLLALLNDKAREAGWGLDGICPWLSSDGLAASAQIQVN